MNKPHMAYTVAKPTDRYVELIYSAVDVKVIYAVFDPSNRITTQTKPLEHVRGQRYRFDLVCVDVRYLSADLVGMGVDPLGEYAVDSNHFPGVKNVIANSQRVGFHSHK